MVERGPKTTPIVKSEDNQWIQDNLMKGKCRVSPASENLIVHLADGSRPWYERYQVMSYNLTTRSGDEQEFANMTRRIYVDVVVNHMTGENKENVGTGGSTVDFKKGQYYGARVCELVGLKDLNQTKEYVRDKIGEYFNNLVKLGVAGFRVDAAKHMFPSDLKVIYDGVNNLSTSYGFKPNSRPYIFQEVHSGSGAIKHSDYTPLGDVTEFRVGSELKRSFSGNNPLKWLVSWGERWNLSPSDKVLVFIDNHDTQRTDDVLTYKESRAYKAAIAFMLAHPYGSPRVMSSFFFNLSDGALQEPGERHSRTELGVYCDVITGTRSGQSCSGTNVTVQNDGTANIRLRGNAEDIVLAIHVGTQVTILQ
ncbi:Alpha-amylase [Operophtera brumata]|uniref:alpha-amylase n=1 Tax=Operophtera brumata TaxID=104452 RepID=A0A0L7LQA0_OPEBR|nr:Alpha-amylase [Operophtera brumata]